MEKEVLTVKEAAEFLGIRESSLRGMMSRKEISYFKTPRKRVYFSLKELREYVYNRRVYSNAELMAKAQLASLNG